MMLPLRRDISQIEAAHRLAVEAGDRAEPDVEVDVLELGALGLRRRRSRHRRLDEAAAVIDVAAQRHAQRAVGAALGPQRRLVAVGEIEIRQVRGLDVARAVALDRALDQKARPFDRQIVEAHELRPAGHDEGHARLPSGRLDPARQQLVDPRLCKVGLDRIAAVAGFDAARGR